MYLDPFFPLIFASTSSKNAVFVNFNPKKHNFFLYSPNFVLQVELFECNFFKRNHVPHQSFFICQIILPNHSFFAYSCINNSHFKCFRLFLSHRLLLPFKATYLLMISLFLYSSIHLNGRSREPAAFTLGPFIFAL